MGCTNSTLKRLAEPGVRMYLFVLVLFTGAAVFLKLYNLAIIEGGLTVALLIYTLVSVRRRERQLVAYVESVTYDTENAKNNTLTHFPLPIAVFRLDDSRIIWGNEMFFELCGKTASRLDARISDLVEGFSGKWLLEGKNSFPNLIDLEGKRYVVRGNLVRSEQGDDSSPFMGITYWLDVTDYENTRELYEASRPVVGVVVIDNLDELQKNQTDRVKNDLRDSIEDKLSHWKDSYNAVIQRFERDRYLVLLERENYEKAKAARFDVVESVHEVQNTAGLNASISMGFGVDGNDFAEALQYAGTAIELALSRGGDQAVQKNRLSFEFFGGRGLEVETRTKVRSRVFANSFAELVKDASAVMIMGHKFSDMDSIGAAVGVCAIARYCGKPASIIVDEAKTAAGNLIEMLKQDEEYKNCFVEPSEAIFKANARTLLVVVDTSRPERTEDFSLVECCKKVVVIDHHRVGATYIENAALGVIEPSASSACELITEMVEEITELKCLKQCEANALLAGMVMDTKNFTLRTGDRTFDAAAALKRAGADTLLVKRMLQSNMTDTVAKYTILQAAEQYRNVAIAVPDQPAGRVVAAKAADELLNISGVEASVVIIPDGKGGVAVSARSIGELNVQLIMEKIGGGGNRNVAAAQFENTDTAAVRERVCAAIDEYLEGK